MSGDTASTPLASVRKLSAFIPVSNEMLADQFNPFAPDTRTPEQRAIDAMNRAAERAETQATTRARHAAAVAASDPALLPILELHKPVFSSWGSAVCHGCDFGGYEGESPEWPCRTWDLVAGDV